MTPVRASKAGCRTLAQPPEVLPQVRAAGFVRDRHCEKNSGLEPAAELFGQAGHFDRIAYGLFSLVEFQVASEQPIDFRLLA